MCVTQCRHVGVVFSGEAPALLLPLQLRNSGLGLPLYWTGRGVVLLLPPSWPLFVVVHGSPPPPGVILWAFFQLHRSPLLPSPGIMPSPSGIQIATNVNQLKNKKGSSPYGGRVFSNFFWLGRPNNCVLSCHGRETKGRGGNMEQQQFQVAGTTDDVTTGSQAQQIVVQPQHVSISTTEPGNIHLVCCEIISTITIISEHEIRAFIFTSK